MSQKKQIFLTHSVVNLCRSDAAFEEQRSRKREAKWRSSSRFSKRQRQVNLLVVLIFFLKMFATSNKSGCVLLQRLQATIVH